MPIWGFIALFALAMLACPVGMWVMSKVTRRKMSCAMCDTPGHEEHADTLGRLEARKAALEQEISQLKMGAGSGR